jgi:hypothetical protein
MKSLLLAMLCCSATALVGQDANIREVGRTPVETKFSAGGHLRMDLCPGGIELVGKDEGQIRVSYSPERDDDVKIRLRVSGNHADLSVTDCPHKNFRVTIEVPKASDLYVRMMAGELIVLNIVGDKDVELHFGQLTMEVGKPDDIEHVEASVNSGDLEASGFGVSKGGLFRSFERGGPGKYRVRAHVGAGQLELR